METQGKIRECPHCGGKGKCYCDGCRASFGLQKSRYDFSAVVCSACEGKGEVWIGPPPQPNELHQHSHTHEVAANTGWEEQLFHAVNSLIGRFDEIVEQQSLILSQVVRVLENFEDSALQREAGQFQHRREDGREGEV